MGKRGRPKAAVETASRGVRVTDAQWAAWERAGATRGLTRNAWICEVLDRAAARAPVSAADAPMGQCVGCDPPRAVVVGYRCPVCGCGAVEA
jgi:hypothetical protein